MFFIQHKKILLLVSSIFFMNHGDLFSFFIWQFPPSNISATGRAAFTDQVAIDSFGNGIAVWYRSDGSKNIVQASRYVAATRTWGPVQDLSAAGQNATNPQVAMDPFGNGTATWSRTNGTNTIVQACRYDVASNTWGAVQDLSAAGQNADFSQVAMDGLGNAIVMWQRSNGTNLVVQTSRYDNVTMHAWEPTMDLSDSAQPADGSAIAMDSMGNGIAVWRGTDGFKYIIRTRRYDNVTTHTWQAVQDLSDASQNAQNAQVAMDAVGNATVVWRRFDGLYDLAQAIRYDNVTTHTWQTVQTLSATGQHATTPQIAMGGVGNAIAVWGRSNGSFTVVESSIYTVGTSTWQPVEIISGNQYAALLAQVGMDQLGNGMVVWQSSNGISVVIYARRYDNTATRTWLPADTLSVSGTALHASAAQIAMNPLSNAITVWRRPVSGFQVIQGSIYSFQLLCDCCEIFANHALYGRE